MFLGPQLNAAVLCELHICALPLRMPLYGGHYGKGVVFVFEKRGKRIAMHDPFLRKLKFNWGGAL